MSASQGPASIYPQLSWHMPKFSTSNKAADSHTNVTRITQPTQAVKPLVPSQRVCGRCWHVCLGRGLLTGHRNKTHFINTVKTTPPNITGPSIRCACLVPLEAHAAAIARKRRHAHSCHPCGAMCTIVAGHSKDMTQLQQMSAHIR